MGLSEQEQCLSSLSTATQPPTQAEEASPVLRLRIPDQRELTQVLMVAGAGAPGGRCSVTGTRGLWGSGSQCVPGGEGDAGVRREEKTV